jgi:hypothetical protein
LQNKANEQTKELVKTLCEWQTALEVSSKSLTDALATLRRLTLPIKGSYGQDDKEGN